MFLSAALEKPMAMPTPRLTCIFLRLTILRNRTILRSQDKSVCKAVYLMSYLVPTQKTQLNFLLLNLKVTIFLHCQ